MHFCTAEHFPLENVRQNAFCRFLTFCKQNVRAASLFFAKQKTQHFCIKCIFASNAFDAKMHFGNAPTKCTHLCFLQSKKHSIFASNAFLHQMHFCTASLFFAKQKTQHFCTALLCFAKIHFCIKYIFASNTFLHQMHFCHR